MMLTDICRDDCIVELSVDLFNNIQRAHQMHAVSSESGCSFFHAVDLLQAIFLSRTLSTYSAIFVMRFFGICYDRNIHMNISGNGSRIDVNMDNLCIWRKFMKFTCDTVVKACPDRETADHSW